jgi:protein-disulfide isomerase
MVDAVSGPSRSLGRRLWRDPVGTAVLVVAVALGLVAWRVRQREPAPPPPLPPALVAAAMSDGSSFGDSTATPVALIFVDYQCEVCALLHQLLEDLVEDRSAGVHVIMQQYPMPALHREAVAAASAAVCAGQQGQFVHMHRTLLRNQDRLGVTDWSQLAAESQVDDLSAFDGCMSDPATGSKVLDMRRRGRELGVRATPAAVIGGHLVYGPSIIDSVLVRLR